MAVTVVEHVLTRLKKLGIREVFGVPGDFSFGITDAVVGDPELRWIGTSNELNAAYAADGYARVKGFGALSTAFGVGELSALNGIAGSYTEHVPVFHLAGMPNTKTQRERRLVHHTLGKGEFDVFLRMSQTGRVRQRRPDAGERRRGGGAPDCRGPGPPPPRASRHPGGLRHRPACSRPWP